MYNRLLEITYESESRERQREKINTKIVRLLYVWNWMDFTLKTITSHFFFGSFFAHAFAVFSLFFTRELVTVPFRSCRSQFATQKYLFQSIFNVCPCPDCLFFVTAAAAFFFFVSIVRNFFFSFLPNERELGEQKKAKPIVWCNILGIFCLAALKTNSKRQFYVWKQRLFRGVFFLSFLRLEFYVHFKLFFIIYLFLILFYGGERANIYYLSVQSVSFFSISCVCFVVFGWMAVCSANTLVRMSDTTTVQL